MYTCIFDLFTCFVIFIDVYNQLLLGLVLFFNYRHLDKG